MAGKLGNKSNKVKLGSEGLNIFQSLQRVPALCGFWDLKKKTMLRKIRIIGTIGGPHTNAKIPHLCIHKPKIK